MKMLFSSKTQPTGLRAQSRARENNTETKNYLYSKQERFSLQKGSTRRMYSIIAIAMTVAACRGGSGGTDTASADMIQLEAARKKTNAVVAPTPPPPSGAGTTDVNMASLEGVAPIASNFDPESQLQTAPIPGSAAPDVVGAFRFICMPGQLKADDPIVYPGQPGRSHLHQFFGNDLADANSTYTSLRSTGNSSCMLPVNWSAYWMPALLNGKGKVLRPDYVSIYYKRRPLTDPVVSDPNHPQYMGKGIKLPNGLRFIFGRNMLNLAAAPTGAYRFECDGPSAPSQKSWTNLEDAQVECGVENRIGIRINAPECWDGKNLDSPDHRSHVSFGSYGGWGYLKCPDTHPYVIPQFTMAAWFTQAAGETYSLVSDSMDTSPGHKRGDTFHADFFMAWDPLVHDMWEKNCIDKMLNCSAGVLGNGKMIKQTWPHSWFANPRLVDPPA